MAGGRYLPSVNFTVTPANTVGAVVLQETLNRVASPVSKQQAQCVAYNTVLPVWYGLGRRGALVADIGTYQGRLVLFALWGRGPHDGLVSFTIDDAAPPAGVLATHYDGTQVAADPVLAAMYGGGYADVLPGVVYSVVQIPPGETSGMPQLAATWRGRKLYDPRSGLTVYSENRALWLADFIVSPVYGAGAAIDWDTVATVANDCDELVGGFAGQYRRSGGGLVLDARKFTRDWTETLRTYAGCSLMADGGPVRLVSNRPRAPVADFAWAAGNMLALGPLKSAPRENVPSVVEIKYTDTSQLPWRETSVFAPTDGLPLGSIDMRLSTVALPAIQDKSQAQREAIERLNTLTLCELSTTLQTMGEGSPLEPGDRIRLTDPVAGLSLKEFLITRSAGAAGRYTLSLLETDPDMFSDVIVTASSTPDTVLPLPSNPPTPTGLTAPEELVQRQDGTWTSRLRLGWTLPDWPYPIHYAIEMRSAGVLIASATTWDTEWSSPAVVELANYELRVAAVSSGGQTSAWAQINITAQGKYLPPGPVPADSFSGFEAGGTVHLSWGAAVDIDIWRYRLKYGSVATAYADATLLDVIDGLRYQAKTVPTGLWRFWVESVDSVRNESGTPRYKDVTVTLDNNAFLVDSYEQTNPTLVNLHEYRANRTDGVRHFVTDDGASWNSVFSGAMSGYTDPVYGYFAGLASSWTGETEDFTQDLGGDWTGTATVSALAGTVASEIQLALAATPATWVGAGALTAKANARFARLKHTAAAGSSLHCAIPNQSVRLDAVPREEVINGTSSAAGPVTVTLTNAYAQGKRIVVQPSGNTARLGVYDNVVVGTTTTVDVYVFSDTGVKIASPFTLIFQGV